MKGSFKMRKNKIAAAVSSFMIAAYMTVPLYAESAVPKAKPSEYVHGDVNLDGMIDVTDITQLGLALVDKVVLDDIHFAYSDADYDGEVNLVDYAILRQYVSKKITSLPEPKEVSYVSYEERKKSSKQTAEPDYTPDPSVVPSEEPEPEAEETGVVAKPVPTYLPVVFDKIDADGYLKFAADSAEKVLVDSEDTRGKENPVYSPLSYYMALSMAAECANGNTRDEIVDVLGKKEETEAEISEWISRKTKEKIKPDIFIKDPESDIVRLINAVAFKDAWKEEFDAEMTKKNNFFKRDGSKISCDFMKEHNTGTEVGTADKFMMYSKEMKNGYTMNFVLPDEGVDINDILSDEKAVRGDRSGLPHL